MNRYQTDDSDRWTDGACDQFEADPSPDYDGMEYDDLHAAPKCGYPGRFGDIVPCCCDENGKLIPGHPGCRHCNSVDAELKPYGFGIESHDSPEWDAARNHFRNVWVFVTGCTGHIADYRPLLRKWAVEAGWSARRERASELIWDHLCYSCETHAEAKKKYTRWAKRTISRKYRDQ